MTVSWQCLILSQGVLDRVGSCWMIQHARFEEFVKNIDKLHRFIGISLAKRVIFTAFILLFTVCWIVLD